MAGAGGVFPGAGGGGGFDFELRREAMAMLKHKNGIIIDPNAANRASLRAMLGTIGMVQVLQASGAVDALRRVKERTVDVILCDYLLEDGRDGQQLLEEMRTRRLIPLSTAFIVITRERRYQSVVSVAELAPDDYLLKPFTPQQLLERIEAVLEKKHAFRHAHRQVEAGQVDPTLTACDDIIGRHPQYRLDALRLKAETLMAAKRTPEAQELYRQILAHKAVPWAKMGLAIASHRTGQLAEAADLTADILHSHPTYIAAYDLAAKIDEERGLTAEAQGHLSQAVAHAPHALARQRQLGRLAVENGDLDAAAAALSTVISRGAGTSLREVGDYAQLARVQMESGKPAAALETASALRRDLRDDPGARVAGNAMAALAHVRLGNQAEAAKSAALALEGAQAAGDAVAAHLLVDVAQAAMVTGQGEKGQALLRRAIAHSDGDSRFSQYVDRVMATFQETAGAADDMHEDVRQHLVHINNEGVRLGMAGQLDEAIRLFRETVTQMPSTQMLANAGKAILAKLNRDGWDAGLAAEAKGYLDRAAARSPDDAKVREALGAYRTVAGKYGVRQTEGE